ncbi:MAG: hypothetical protein ACXVII_35195, partial [Solirubrobacteraceae bacterium]
LPVNDGITALGTTHIKAPMIGEPRSPSGDDLRALVPDIADRHVYVCGPTEMTRATRATLRRYGVPAAQITTEGFSL